MTATENPNLSEGVQSTSTDNPSTENELVQPETQLLPDMWAECFSHLGCERDLTVAAQVCSSWRDVVYAYDSLWESFASRAEPWEETGR